MKIEQFPSWRSGNKSDQEPRGCGVRSLALLSGLRIWRCHKTVVQVADAAQIWHCGCGTGQQLQLQLDPYPGDLHMPWVQPSKDKKKENRTLSKEYPIHPCREIVCSKHLKNTSYRCCFGTAYKLNKMQRNTNSVKDQQNHQTRGESHMALQTKYHIFQAALQHLRKVSCWSPTCSIVTVGTAGAPRYWNSSLSPCWRSR